MTENENLQPEVASAEAVEQTPSKLAKFGAGVKEWFRKQIVALKRRPQNIALVFALITSITYLICLRDFSITITQDGDIEWGGLAVFINSLLSVLVLALFLSAFPKRKKPNYIFVALVFVFYAVMIGMDVLYYINTSSYMASQNETVAEFPKHFASLREAIAHIVMLGICIILLAALPLYSKLIRMINTKKEIASSQLNEEIDTEDE